MAAKSYSLPKGLYASGVFFLGLMTSIPLLVSRQMGDMSELVSFLKSRNPRIEVTRAAS